jgi:Predicted membrane protein (DUF2127)
MTTTEDFAGIRTPRRHRWFAAFFAFGATMCGLTIGLLLFPGPVMDSIWRLNPDAHLAFQSIGSWSIIVMGTVGMACLVAAIGLWRGAMWGTRLALIILSVNIIGHLINALVRHDYRSLIGLPIGAGMISYLIRSEPWPNTVARGHGDVRPAGKRA